MPALPWSLLARWAFRVSQDPETRGKGWSKEDAPLVDKGQVREYFNKLDIPKSMGTDGMHS